MNLVDMLAVHATARASLPAIIDGERIVTYRELYPLVAAAAARLKSAGIKADDLVGVSLNDSIETLVIFHALAWIGAVIVCLPPSLPRAERASLASAFGVTAIIGAEAGAAIDSIPFIHVDSDWWSAGEGIAREIAAVSGGDRPLVLTMTSGTTSGPRGVLSTHAQILWRLSAGAAGFGITAADRYLSVVSMSLNVGRNFCFMALQLGGTVVINHAGQAVDRTLAMIERETITWMFLVPPQIRQLLAHDRQGGLLLPTVRVLISGGALLRPDERQAVRERLTPNFIECYGANEVGVFTVSRPADQIARPDSVGRVIPGIEAEIVDEEQRPVVAGAVGRIRLRSPAFPRGYYRNPQATTLAFRDGWFYPGDLATIDADGFVYLKGRVDDLINYAGLKVYPSEVEACLHEHPAVAEAAVIGAPAPEVQEVVIAFVVVEGRADERDLLDFCRQRLAAHKVPKRIFATRQLPKNDAGKVVKQALRDSLDRLRAATKPG